MREVEIRGPIRETDLARISVLAKQSGWQHKAYNQVSVYCDTDEIKAIGSIREGKARIILDIREDAARLKLKVGNPLNREREEYAMTIERRDLRGIVTLLRLFGITDGFLRSFDRTDYDIGDLQLTVKLNCLMGDHYELEGENEEAVHKLARTLGLRIWNREELADAIEQDHQKAVSRNISQELKRLRVID